MSVTLDIPPHILERVRNDATAKGISLDEMVVRLLSKDNDELNGQPSLSSKSKFGRMPGVVVYIADDFDAIPEGFEDYVG
jgi:hypothetical protein